ncbi:hypothetical protein [Xylanibacter rodentium]|jgi:hypothetical protein|uniref:Lipoprotein n=2 Tax=Xylanibacter rodentium TaxID=2736289 RepID=A0ABX2ATM2_9BACT|nr:hypothetical protein [Xylanibacter rodentium]NPE10350.1 hypothetical protein [Prevotella sp. PJ1A]NPE12991.1 hypothetical protein [Xylanibacter rodentium]NPE39237.1 hypothetical protein [Prevotella sp. PCJ2]
MKTLVFMFVAVVAISFASCGGNKTEQAAPVDSDTVVVDSVVADSAVVDSAAIDSVVTD